MQNDIEEASESLADKIVSRLSERGNTRPLSSAEVPTSVRSFTVDAEITRLQKQIAERDEKLARIEDERRTELARKVAEEFFTDEQLLPAGLPAVEALAKLLTSVGSPVPETVEYTTPLGQPKRVTPVQLLRDVFAEVPQHNLLTDHEGASAPKGALLLMGGEPDVDLEEEKAHEDVKRLIKGDKRSNNGRSNHRHNGQTDADVE